jgi:hypothetical protein
MSRNEFSLVSGIADPQLRNVLDQIVNVACIAAEKAVAHSASPGHFPISPDAGSLEQIFLSHFRHVRSVRRQKSINKVMLRLKDSKENRRRLYGALSEVNLRLPVAVEKQAVDMGIIKLRPDSIHRTEQPAGGTMRVMKGGTADPAPPVATPSVQVDKLVFEIQYIYAMMTTPDAGDNDEIRLGGVGVTPAGNTFKLNEYKVGNFEHNQFDQVTYAPPYWWAQFDLNEGGDKWPKYFFVTATLCEEDHGGFSEFTDKLYENIREKVKAAVEAYCADTMGPLGIVIGYGIGYVVDEIFDKLKEWYTDDILGVATAQAMINAPYAGDGDEASQQYTMEFTRCEGDYILAFDWRLCNERTSLKCAEWVHGNAVRPEFPDRLVSSENKGWGAEFRGKAGTSNWFHFPITTPVIEEGTRPLLSKIFVLFKSDEGAAIDQGAAITNLHIYDGKNIVKSLACWRRGNHTGAIDQSNTWRIDPPITIYSGLGISAEVEFRTESNITFATAGADFATLI